MNINEQKENENILNLDTKKSFFQRGNIDISQGDFTDPGLVIKEETSDPSISYDKDESLVLNNYEIRKNDFQKNIK